MIRKALPIAILAATTLSLSGCGFFSKIKNEIRGKNDSHQTDNTTPWNNNPTGNTPSGNGNSPSGNNPSGSTPSGNNPSGNTPKGSAPTINYSPNATFHANSQHGAFQTTSYQGQTGASNANSNLIPVDPLSPEERAIVMRAFENTNRLRAEKGLKPLVYDESLGAYASVRAREAARYFNHNRPDGRSYSSGFINAVASGENLAAGHSSPDKTVLEQWRKSKGHYANMLGDYDVIGIGYVRDPKSKWGYYWVQIFSTRGAKTQYYFSDKLGAGAPPDVESHLTGQIRFNQGKIDLGNAPSKYNNAARAKSAGELSHPIYSSARSFSAGGHEVVIQDPAGSGFSYHTFGEVIDSQGKPVQYVHVGQSTVPDSATTLRANYRGASLGNLNQDSHVYADVNAQVEFGARKTMDIQFTNSKMALHDIRDQNAKTAVRPATDLDFSERLTWQNNAGQFGGNGVSARFYGPNGEEMGGEFKRQATDGTYQGVFGLQKE